MENYNEEIYRADTIELVNPFNSDPTYELTYIQVFTALELIEYLMSKRETKIGMNPSIK